MRSFLLGCFRRTLSGSNPSLNKLPDGDLPADSPPPLASKPPLYRYPTEAEVLEVLIYKRLPGPPAPSPRKEVVVIDLTQGTHILERVLKTGVKLSSEDIALIQRTELWHTLFGDKANSVQLILWVSLPCILWVTGVVDFKKIWAFLRGRGGGGPPQGGSSSSGGGGQPPPPPPPSPPPPSNVRPPRSGRGGPPADDGESPCFWE